MNYYAGLDIGGTKCAALIGAVADDGTIEILAKEKFPTAGKPEAMLEKLCDAILTLKGDKVLTAAGIANGKDVYDTIIAGADATGSSSGVAKAADRAAMVDEMIAAVRKAWDERHN